MSAISKRQYVRGRSGSAPDSSSGGRAATAPSGSAQRSLSGPSTLDGTASPPSNRGLAFSGGGVRLRFMVNVCEPVLSAEEVRRPDPRDVDDVRMGYGNCSK